MIRTLLLPALAALSLTCPAHANDSEAEVGIGGITLRPSAALVMASEDLFISEEVVRVKYRFTNPTDRPVTTTVAFPLPAEPRGLTGDYEPPQVKQDWSVLNFTTRVDGRPVSLTRVDRAMIGARDVTDRIARLGLPLYWFEGGNPAEVFGRMSAAERARYVAEGLARADPLYEDKVVPAWDVVTFFTREQTFAPRASVTVEHQYTPRNGGSVGGLLEPQMRKEFPEGLANYRKRYCVDDAFLAGVDRRLQAMRQGDRTVMLSETWIGYVLSSGANWKGPIGDFRLVIDKGSPDTLVSFCMTGVRKIAPTQFEVRKTNFEPDRDLRILIAKFNRTDE